MIPVSIIIPAHNQLAYCRDCLASLKRCTSRPHRLILVNNGSTDGVGAFFDNVAEATVVHSPANLGFAGGVNLGLAQAEGHVVLLNSDTLLTPGWLERLEAALLREAPNEAGIVRHAGLAGPMTNCAPGPQQIDGLTLPDGEAIDHFAARLAVECAGQVREVHRLVGFCLMIHADTLEAVGRFDERFGIGNFEDDDYCTRARRAGYRLVIAGDSFVYHHGGRTFAGLGLEGAAFDALLAENRQRYADKWQVHVPAPPAAREQALRYGVLAEEARLRGDSRGALGLLKQAVQAEPGNPDWYAKLAALLFALGEMDLARKLATRSLQLDPHHIHARTMLDTPQD